MRTRASKDERNMDVARKLPVMHVSQEDWYIGLIRLNFTNRIPLNISPLFLTPIFCHTPRLVTNHSERHKDFKLGCKNRNEFRCRNSINGCESR
jgi:hypothetical protein